MSLATKYRPQSFQELCEQQSIIDILQYQIDNDCPKNSYLFAGPAGCGKTTSARILAKELNKGQGTPIEKDAARNNGVDKIRAIIDEAGFQSLDSKYKIFILDEVHMVTTEGFNAMLKILEEPPKNTIFIFCTTDPNKIPATILSRVQRFDFQKIKLGTILNRLKFILEEEKVTTYDDKAVEFVARMANGGMRDAISLLEKCLDYNPVINIDNVVKALGYIDYELLYRALDSLKCKNTQEIIEVVEEAFFQGIDMKFFIKQLISFTLDVCKFSIFGDMQHCNLPWEMEEKLQLLTDNCSTSPTTILKQLNELDNKLRFEPNPKLMVESTLVVLCN